METNGNFPLNNTTGFKSQNRGLIKLEKLESGSDKIIKVFKEESTRKKLRPKHNLLWKILNTNCDSRSLFLLSKKNRFRRFFIGVKESKKFQGFILFIIFLNTLILLFNDYKFRIINNEQSWRNDLNYYSEYIFSSLFTFECLVKIIAKGFILNKEAYLRSFWNIVDFVVVLFGLFNFLPGSPNLTAVRAIRMVRPLKTVNKIKGIKILIQTLLSALPSLANVVFFMFFIILLFAILGMQLWSGIYESRCRLTPNPLKDFSWPIDENEQHLCGTCPNNTYCRAPKDFNVPFNFTEIYNPNFVYGYNTFDNIFFSVFTVFQSITTEGWTQNILTIEDAHVSAVVYLYFILLLLFGSIFVVNLVLAVINESFNSSIQTLKKDFKPSETFTQVEDKTDSYYSPSKPAFNNEMNPKGRKFMAVEKEPDALAEIKELELEIVEDKTPTSKRKLKPELENTSGKEMEGNVSFIIERESEGKIQINNGFTGNQKNSQNIRITNEEMTQRKSEFQLTEMIESKFSLCGSNRSFINNFEEQHESNPESHPRKHRTIDNLRFLKTESKRTGESKEALRLLKSLDFSSDYDRPEGENPFDLKQNTEEICSPKKIDPITIKFSPEQKRLNGEQEKPVTNGLEKMTSKDENTLQSTYIEKNFQNTEERSIKDYKKQISLQKSSLNAVWFAIKFKTSFNIEQIRHKIKRRTRGRLCSRICFDLVTSNYFIYFTTFLILANTVVLSMDRYPISNFEEMVYDLMNNIFTFMFLLEMFLKIIGFGVKSYFKEPMNIFDCFIVVISIIDITLNYAETSTGSYGTLLTVQSFRAFRIFRIFKLVKTWTHLRNLLLALRMSLVEIIWFSMLVLLFMLVFSLLGMELFAYRAFFDTDDNVVTLPSKTKAYSPRSNFDTFSNSMITVFLLLIGDNWNGVMFYYMRALDSYQPAGYFIVVYIIGNLILVNLYMAILINNFESSSRLVNASLKRKRQTTLKSKIRKASKQLIRKMSCFQRFIFMLFKCLSKRRKKRLEENSIELSPKLDTKGFIDSFNDIKRNIRNTTLMDSNENNDQTRKSFINQVLEWEKSPKKNKSLSAYQGKSLFLFGSKSKIKRICFLITNSVYFDYFMLITILVSCVALAVDDPFDDPNSFKNLILDNMDVTITIIFFAEFTLKIVRYGLLFNGKKSYLRNGWNMLDVIIVTTSIFSLITDSNNYDLDKLKVIRLLRILRPLRLISRNEGLKLAINSLILSLPNILNLLFVSSIFFLLFGIMGINFFKGVLFYCDDQNIPNKAKDSLSTRAHCFDYGGNWISKPFNFDSISNSLSTLFVLSNTEGWSNIMYDGIDAVGLNMNPIREYRTFWAIFYIVFILIGNFLIFNMFAGVVVESFYNEKKKLAGYFHLNSIQKEWMEFQTFLIEQNPWKKLRKPKNAFRLLFYKLTRSRAFESFIFLCIFLNTLVFMIDHNRSPQTMTTVLDYINIGFLGIFFIEALFKIIALGFQYFQEALNLFDFTVLCLTSIGVFLENSDYISTGNLGTTTTVFRVFRIVRVLRLIETFKHLRVIFNTLIKSLPQIGNVSALLFLILYIYGVLGMNLFCFVKPGMELSEKINFRSFLSSCFALLRSSTGENWNILMLDISRGKSPSDVCLDVGNVRAYEQLGLMGCGSYMGYIYLISFQLIFSMTVLNLLVAIILEVFSEQNQKEEGKINSKDMERFKKVWRKYDRLGIGSIECKYLIHVLNNLATPHGFRKMKMTLRKKRIEVAKMNLRVYILKGTNICYFNFHEVIFAIAKRVFEGCYGNHLKLSSMNKIHCYRDIIKKLVSKINHKKHMEATEFLSSDWVFAQILIEKAKQMNTRKPIQGSEYKIQLNLMRRSFSSYGGAVKMENSFSNSPFPSPLKTVKKTIKRRRSEGDITASIDRGSEEKKITKMFAAPKSAIIKSDILHRAKGSGEGETPISIFNFSSWKETQNGDKTKSKFVSKKNEEQYLSPVKFAKISISGTFNSRSNLDEL